MACEIHSAGCRTFLLVLSYQAVSQAMARHLFHVPALGDLDARDRLKQTSRPQERGPHVHAIDRRETAASVDLGALCSLAVFATEQELYRPFIVSRCSRPPFTQPFHLQAHLRMSLHRSF